MRSTYSLSSKNYISTMGRFWAVICMLIVMSTVISGRPSGSGSKHMIQQRQKRQSDQRLAELETLLALQKYNGHRVRGWQSHHNDLSPGFGLIDFDKIGRRKKSTRFSPGNSAAGIMDGENTNSNGLESWNAWVSSVMPKASRSNSDSVDSQIIDQK